MALNLVKLSTPAPHFLYNYTPLLFRSVSVPFSSSRRMPPVRCDSISAVDSEPTVQIDSPVSKQRKWKPTCLYFSQSKCTLMGDDSHLEKFNHDLGADLNLSEIRVEKLRAQEFEHLLILDLEGKVEILEFPVVMIDAKNLKFVDSFHRFVRPTAMSEERIAQYIEGKYGKFGVDRVWHDTAIPFKEVLEEFEQWLENHNLWEKKKGGSLNRAAFVTCGNWDLKTKVPDQCRVSKIKLPSYFMEWINVKDIFLNFYNRRAAGMMSMMRELNLASLGSHHLGIDDSKNIARVVQRVISDGALMQITAKRNPNFDVTFRFKNRI